MPLSPTLLEKIACPLTRSRLTEADEATFKEVMEKVASGKIKTRGPVDWKPEEVTGLLITQDGKYAYPIVGGIPNLLPASCILVKL